MPPLKNQRQELFCQEYIVRPESPGACAVIAHYSVKTAPQIASRLLTYVNVRARIAELNELAASKRIATVQERKERLSEAIRARVTDFVHDGQIVVPPGAKNTGAIRKLVKKTKKIAGAIVSEEFTEIELLDPVSNISELNKMEKVYETVPVVNIDNRSMHFEVINLDPKDLATVLRTLSDAGAIRLGPAQDNNPPK